MDGKRALSVVRQWLHDHWQLCKVAYYCGQQGYRFTFRQLKERPAHWRSGGQPVYTVGYCRFPKHGGRTWIEVAYVKGNLNNAIASVWHEIGHAEQYAGVKGRDIPHHSGLLLWHEESDAWQRGLVLAGERGYRMTKDTAADCLRSLLSYLDCAQGIAVGEDPAIVYLMRESL